MAYTAAQLVSLACQICNIPGRTSQVGQMLNLVLANYAQTIDEDDIRKTTTLDIGPTSDIPHFYDLPQDYLRAYDIFYNVLGTVFYLNQFGLDKLDQEYTAEGISNYPEWYATDFGQALLGSTTPPKIAFFPPPAVPITATIRYRPQTADITTPETSTSIPWFPNQLILLKDLCSQAAMLADEDRGPAWEQEVERRMRKYLIMADDTENMAQTVKLDPQTFRLRTNLPPSKKLGY